MILACQPQNEYFECIIHFSGVAMMLFHPDLAIMAMFSSSVVLDCSNRISIGTHDSFDYIGLEILWL